MTTSQPQTSLQDVWPEEIRLSKAKDRLEIRFDDGAEFSLSAELLRVESPSAEVQGHGAGQKTKVRLEHTQHLLHGCTGNAYFLTDNRFTRCNPSTHHP